MIVWCRYSHRVVVVIVLRIRSMFAVRSAIALAPLPPPTPKASKIVHQKVSFTYHQQVRILKPLSRCLSGGLESRCAAAVNSTSLGYVSNARAVRHLCDGAGGLRCSQPASLHRLNKPCRIFFFCNVACISVAARQALYRETNS